MGALQAFAPMSVDMYLPALPELQQVFHATAAEVQRTLAAFFLGFASGQCLYGPITDRFGRKPPLYFSLLVYAAASLGCALAGSIGWLTFFRLLQAVGACGGAVISRAMVRDLFPPLETRRVFSMLMLVNGVAPVLAPLAGGYLLVWLGWKSIFLVQATVGIAALAGVRFRLPETMRFAQPLHLGHVFATYGRFLRDRTLLGSSLVVACSGAGMFAYIASVPFVFISLYHVPEQRFGWYFGSIALGIAAASQINGRLLHGVPAVRVLRFASAVQLAAGLALIAAVVSGTGGLTGIYLPLFAYVSCIGLVFPNGAAVALAGHAEVAGMASAMLGTLQFGAAAISTSLLGAIGEGSALPMAAVVLVSGALAAGLSVFALEVRPDSV